MSSVVRNARTDYHLDTRIRRRHVPLYSQQRRLRHLKCIVARNIVPAQEFDAVGVYFSLHLKPQAPAFYTSEVADDFVNPAWRMFEASSFPDDINTSGGCIAAKIWFKLENKNSTCVFDWFVFFSGLVFIGEQIPKEGKKFKPNTLLFGTPEGFYGSPDCLQVPGLLGEAEYSVKDSIPADPSSVRVSYSVNTVDRIQTVQRAIKQTQATVRRSRISIKEQLRSTAPIQEQKAKQELLRINIAALNSELIRHATTIEQLKIKKRSMKDSMEEIATDQLSRKEQLTKDKLILIERRRYYHETCETLLKTTAQVNLRRKQLISELSCIYPIIIFPDKNGYSICGVHLPHSEDFTGHDDTMISVALGYVTHLVMMISHFLNVPLRYPLHHFGSRSTVLDLVRDKIPDKDREFPLYSRVKDKMHFFYGVYLLNKNIGQLRQYCGLGTPDLRVTLANLHDLIRQRLSLRSEQQNSQPYAAVFQNLYLPSLQQPQLSVQIKSDPSRVLSANKQNGSATSLSALNPESSSLEVSSEFTNVQVPNHVDIMESLEREIANMASTTPVHQGILSSKMAALSSSEVTGNLSCSLDKGLNEIRILQMKMSQDDSSISGSVSPKSSRREMVASSFQTGSQHASVPNLSSLALVVTSQVVEIADLKVEREKLSFNPNLALCTMESVNNSDDDLLECRT